VSGSQIRSSPDEQTVRSRRRRAGRSEVGKVGGAPRAKRGPDKAEGFDPDVSTRWQSRGDYQAGLPARIEREDIPRDLVCGDEVAAKASE
jgi:hypothetical protein